jgi:hypothetical protein
VSYNGSSWRAVQANLNMIPVEGVNWTLLAQVGASGSTGSIGATGPAGVTGATGATGPLGVLDSDSNPVPPWGMTEPWSGFATITAPDPIVASDSLASLRTKVMAAVRPNWTPTVSATDLVRVIWLDSGGLLNL